MGSSVARFDCYFARSEAEARITARMRGPGFGRRRTRRSIEAGIDLDGIEVAHEIDHRVEAPGLGFGVHDAFPILVCSPS